MTEWFTEKELCEYFRSEVREAGGAKKWLRKHKVAGYDGVLHMIEDGRGASLDPILSAIGFRKVTLYESIADSKASPAEPSTPAH